MGVGHKPAKNLKVGRLRPILYPNLGIEAPDFTGPVYNAYLAFHAWGDCGASC